MNTIKGSYDVPIIYTAHHASHNFRQFDSRVALTKLQKLRFSDYGTDKTVPQNGIATIVASHSRALGDLNRNPDDPGRFQEQDYARPAKHPIWKPKQGLSDSDKKYCQVHFHEPFHNEIVKLLQPRTDPTFIVAWDNTAHYDIGNDSLGDPVTMKPFIISNRGIEGSSQAGNAEPTSCDPLFLDILVQHFAAELSQRGLPNEIYLNLVFKGGYICRQYSTLCNKNILRGLGINCDVQSLQLEYDTSITHDQITLEFKPEKMNALRQAFTAAIKNTYLDYIV